MVAYVRTVKTASGATAVQIVWSTRRGLVCPVCVVDPGLGVAVAAQCGIDCAYTVAHNTN